jgi:ABC-type antimicrobial peptide transport system permease subunit
VINEAFVKRHFDSRSPIGMRIARVENDQRTCHVVGVAMDARTQDLRSEVAPRYFRAAAQTLESAGSPTFLIRTAADTEPVIGAVRKTIQDLDASLPIFSAGTIEEQMAPLTAQDRATAQLAVVFGLVAVSLAAIGLYGLLSYGVARRSGEIAVRMALGAAPARVTSMILRETVWVVVGGLAAGGGLAYAVSRLIDTRLYGVAPQDPLTMALSTGVLLAVALGAAYWPARRASQLDPMTVLR